MIRFIDEHRDQFSREFTLVGENPALDPFTDMAAEIRADAEHQAREYGRALATQRQTV